VPELREHERLQLSEQEAAQRLPSRTHQTARVAGNPSRSPAVVDTSPQPPANADLGSVAFGELLIERRRRRDALDAHIASLSSIQRAGMVAMVRHGLGLKDRDWQARYDELVAALDVVERAVHEALGVMDISPPHSEHAIRVGG
jgi:hypothetical protein